ncbi:hypothetical protein QOT17_020139 [Balamuthia mandrillaris]
MQQQKAIGLALVVCWGLVAMVAARTPVSADDSFIRYDGEHFQVRFGRDNSTELYVFPRDRSTGEIVEDYWFFFQVYEFRERRCSSVRQQEDNPRNFISTIGTLENCTDENFYELDLEQLSVEKAQLQQLNDRMAAYTVNGFGNPHSKLIIAYEVVEDSEQRLFTNSANTTRTVDINANSLKISFDIQNYTSQVINEHELSNGNAYSSFYFHTRFELSHTILPFLYPSTSVSSSPLHPWVEQITEDRIATLIKVVDAPFQVQLSQCTFSLNEPPTASKTVLNSSDWGFEQMDTIIFDYDESNPEPYATTFGLVIKMVGGKDILYDPDISILLTNEDDGTEDETNNDDISSEEKAIVISVTVVIPIVIIVAIVGGITLRILRAKRRKQRKERLEKMVAL